MAQAQAFETDFWKDANLRKVWDDIVPGEPRKTLPYVLTKEAIYKPCPQEPVMPPCRLLRQCRSLVSLS